MSSINPYINNGTCYYGPNNKAAAVFLPCGNDALGYQTCCQAGDMCLSSKSCYNGEYGVTYLAGCSDPKYRDPHCPDKQTFADDPWTGLSRCDGTTPVVWVQCGQADRVSTLTKPSPCTCNADMPIFPAFTDKSKLDNVAQLPTASGESIIFQPGYAPTLTYIATGTVTSSSSLANPTTTSIYISPTPSPKIQEYSSLSNASQVGIGAGVGIAGLLLIGVVAVAYVLLRRKKAKGPSQESNGPEDAAPDSKHAIDLAQYGSPTTTAPSELESIAAWPWAVRSELPDHTVQATAVEVSGESKRLSELPA